MSLRRELGAIVGGVSVVIAVTDSKKAKRVTECADSDTEKSGRQHLWEKITGAIAHLMIHQLALREKGKPFKMHVA
jgi:hypothetical protein